MQTIALIYIMYDKQILKAILAIDNTYPNDNLITTYKDFLKQKDYLF